MIIPVILAGGTGSRLWPLSRETFPKQFMPLFEGQSLFEKTLMRCQGLPDLAGSIVVGGQEHKFLLQRLLESTQIPTLTTLLEPTPKSTAPAIGLAVLSAMSLTQEDPVLVVLPADHVIEDLSGFQHSVLQAYKAAKEGYLVTFGIQPQYPETGYGYIQAGDPLPGFSCARVKAFIEKPDLAHAKTFVQSKSHYWNSGMFVFQASQYLAQMQKHAPVMYEQVQDAWQKHAQDQDGFMMPGPAWGAIESDSIDFAVMEKTDKAAMLPLQSNWSDIGSWSALADIYPKDAQGNTKMGDTQVHETQDSFLWSHKRMIATVGLKNMVVVETPDVILVADKQKAQDIKPLVEHLKKQARPEVKAHQKVHRPWGSFESVDQGPRHQVKRIIVEIGERLSLQMHHHRSEHWVVVKGTARVTRGDEVFLLSENQSTYIPVGVKHRLENVGKIPLEIIEVQSGSYLGEDDIVRFDDQYGRTKVSASQV